jgi:hypothetical protein
VYTVKEKGGKPDRKPYSLPYGLEIHTETSGLRTFKIMPRNCRFMNSASELQFLELTWSIRKTE